MTEGRRYHIAERNIALCILFTIITCGIYGLYWLYKMAEEVNMLTDNEDDTSAGLVLVFTIITCGIYGVYWAYRVGQKFRIEAQSRNSNDADDCSLIYLVLYIANYFVGVTTLVCHALIQDRINQLLRIYGLSDKPVGNKYTYVKEDEIRKDYEAKAENWSFIPEQVPATTSSDDESNSDVAD